MRKLRFAQVKLNPSPSKSPKLFPLHETFTLNLTLDLGASGMVLIEARSGSIINLDKSLLHHSPLY